MGKFTVLPLFLMLLCLVGCSGSIKNKKRERLGLRALEEYCTTEGMSMSDFSGPQVGTTEGYDWVVEFQSNTSPKHILLVYVRGGEIVERHRFVK